MQLSQILKPESVITPLKGSDKDSIIEELVDVLAGSGQISDREKVLDSVMTREETRSTGIGSGIAIPHGKSSGTSELVMSVGICPAGIDFDSIDNKPVNIVLLLASPVDKTGPHIQALARISRVMLDDELRKAIIAAKDPKEVYELITSRDSE
ncbi:EIIABC-Fru [Limihaloglobus sulfuriphilus]|uniref:EIIABC-Fru n=1 Tax=Limihaloglobus sulfuriphilus TaxID=1851148 RepID=A0A1Q2MCC4_9BACT|nr:PTS sugar transporter subunit IIA [Limihaloglobus sulfuriphilus]AQQ69917.1 EIIABC-Fru [Limihaloglobus sulfuriphilus]